MDESWPVCICINVCPEHAVRFQALSDTMPDSMFLKGGLLSLI